MIHCTVIKLPRLVWAERLTVSGELMGQLDPILRQYWANIKSQQLEAIPNIIEWVQLHSPIQYIDALSTFWYRHLDYSRTQHD